MMTVKSATSMLAQIIVQRFKKCLLNVKLAIFQRLFYVLLWHFIVVEFNVSSMLKFK